MRRQHPQVYRCSYESINSGFDISTDHWGNLLNTDNNHVGNFKFYVYYPWAGGGVLWLRHGITAILPGKLYYKLAAEREIPQASTDY